jgi:hypothetical protein
MKDEKYFKPARARQPFAARCICGEFTSDKKNLNGLQNNLKAGRKRIQCDYSKELKESDIKSYYEKAGMKEY